MGVETLGKVFGSPDEKTMEQALNCIVAGADMTLGSTLCADAHLGYSQPIGLAVAYRGLISISGVGYDIGCGNKAVRTNLKRSDIQTDLPRIMQEINAKVSFGMGRKNSEKVDHPVLDAVAKAAVVEQRTLTQLAVDQLGTVGSGNHYVDLGVDEQDNVWIAVHFGSRGFGHKTATGFISLAHGNRFSDTAHEGDMMAYPTLLRDDALLGQAYIEAMQLAGDYAYAGRDVVVDKVLQILGASSDYGVHNHHNFAWKENHFGEDVWVTRKGCTPAFPGQEGFVGGSMGDISVVLAGTDTPEAKDALYTTMHGAGRVMSRGQAAGRVKITKVWKCGSCKKEFPAKQFAGGVPQCPSCRKPMEWRRRKEVKRQGLVDWPAWQQKLSDSGIVVVGGGADESPEVYRRLQDVLDAHKGTINVRHVIRPIGVVMAGADVRDDYKD
jgi:tRNA-splicing ligase RtcB (3'-phosphate/5'-hydroxy nucleic acid ligase)